jgi:error-prone DNA polymerase
MIARGYDPDFARRCFKQIEGFGSYGFPESHAASFAKLVYVSSWIKCHHPAIFACALLNSQPMGFYAPAQIVRDAREHGVEARGVDVGHSLWDNTLERRDDGALALRLGFRQIDGMQQAEGERLVAARGAGYASVEQVARRARLNGRAMRALADADAFRSFGLDRRAALWEVRRLPDDDALPLFAAAAAAELGAEEDARLPAMSLGEHVATDYQMLRLSLKAHPMQILRPLFSRERASSAEQIAAARDGARARMAGVVLVRQRPGKGNAIFITLEDETGVVNIVLWARLFERFRKETMGARLMLVEGLVQRSPEGVVHLMAQRVVDRSAELDRLWRETGRAAAIGPDKDEAGSRKIVPEPLRLAPPPRQRHPRDARLLPRSRDFH